MGGKSSAPAAPDYVAQANATSQGNLNAARAQTTANRMDQVTPYGTIKYTQSGGQFDQYAYDQAMDKYRRQQEELTANPQLREYYGKTGALLTAPDRNSFMPNPDQWSSQIQLSDTGQQLLDAYNRSSLGLAGLQDAAVGRVGSALSTPFDTSGIPDVQYGVDLSGLNSEEGMQGWQKYSDLLMQRMNPDLDAQQAALDSKLANQGLTQGSEGWGTQMNQFGKQRNDANIAAQLAGTQVQSQFYNQALQKAGLQFQNAGLNNAGRQQSLTERATLRQMPLQELNALRSGAQVTNPTFSTPGQQGQTSGPDLMGAANSSYNAQLGNVNAQNAQAAQTTQAGIGTAALAVAAFY